MKRITTLMLAVMAFGGAPVFAADYPTKPVRFIVPWPPGGSTDILARAIGNELSKAFNQSVVIENKGGGGGSISNQSEGADMPSFMLL